MNAAGSFFELQRRGVVRSSDALNAPPCCYLAFHLTFQGALGEAETMARRTLQLQPASQFAALVFVLTRVQGGHEPPGREVVARLPQEAISDALRTNFEHMSGNRAAADAALQILIERDADGAAYRIAEAYAQRNDADMAFEWLERTWANRDPGISFLLLDACLKPYRHDPRFAAFAHEGVLSAPVPGTVSPSKKVN